MEPLNEDVVFLWYFAGIDGPWKRARRGGVPALLCLLEPGNKGIAAEVIAIGGYPSKGKQMAQAG